MFPQFSFFAVPPLVPPPLFGYPPNRVWRQDSAQCVATEKTLARAWTVGKPLKAYKPHQPAQTCRPQNRAAALFTCSRFDGRETLQSLQTPPTAKPAGLRIGPRLFTGSRFVGKKPLKTHQTLPSHPAGCSCKPTNSKQHHRRKLGGQPPLTWQLSARSGRPKLQCAAPPHRCTSIL